MARVPAKLQTLQPKPRDGGAPPLKSGGRSALVDPLCAQARGSLEKDNDGCVGATKPYPTIFAPTSVTLGGQTGLLDGLRAKVDVACGNDIKTLTDNFSPRTGVESLLREPAPAGPRDPQRPPAIPRDPMPTPAANINTGENAWQGLDNMVSD